MSKKNKKAQSIDGNTGHCVAYTCEGVDPFCSRVEYNVDLNPHKFVEETEFGNDNPRAFEEPIVLLINPCVGKTTVVDCLEGILKKIKSEGLFLGSRRHGDQGLDIYDIGERLHGEPM